MKLTSLGQAAYFITKEKSSSESMRSFHHCQTMTRLLRTTDSKGHSYATVATLGKSEGRLNKTP